MKKFQKLIIVTFCFLLAVSASYSQKNTQDFKTITFKAEDGLDITGDVYLKHDLKAPFIVLFHQAGWSRGEYREIAPKLNEMGFNCLAVDQRSGGKVNGVQNQTNAMAVKTGKKTSYIDAYVDMSAALNHAGENYAQGKLVIWGSSYSSALVIKLAGDFPQKVDGALSFAPGEYFASLGKTKTFITEAAKNVKCPVFITSAKNEKPNWDGIFKAIPATTKRSFVPTTQGKHGSRALWDKFADSKDYWTAVNNFLVQFIVSE